MSRIVAFCGAAGAGKDEAARALVGAGYTRMAFAAPMRKAVLSLDPFVGFDPKLQRSVRLSELVEREGWDGAKRNCPEVRRLMQRFGTEAGRDIHGEDCWVKALFSEWFDEGEPRLVISDLRFKNEADAVRGVSGIIVRIERPGLDALPGGHASEAGIPDDLVDYVIFNDGTIAELHRNVLDIVENLS